jgi:Na+-translocating ferredoxin:NAD+ oxidoreductase RnfG subunit
LETKRKAIHAQTLALAVIVVILTAGFAYYYVTTQNQISSLVRTGQNLCIDLNVLSGEVVKFFNNLTLALQSQIQNDNSLIQSLNSTKPAGYTGMIATLNGQIAQDSTIMGGFADLNSGGALETNTGPCAAQS